MGLGVGSWRRVIYENVMVYEHEFSEPPCSFERPKPRPLGALPRAWGSRMSNVVAVAGEERRGGVVQGLQRGLRCGCFSRLRVTVRHYRHGRST